MKLRNLKLISWNCNGFRDRFDDLKQKFMQDNDIIILQETKFTPDSNVRCKGFNIFRKERLTGLGGGLMIMIREDIPTEVIKHTYHKENVLESLKIKININ